LSCCLQKFFDCLLIKSLANRGFWRHICKERKIGKIYDRHQVVETWCLQSPKPDGGPLSQTFLTGRVIILMTFEIFLKANILLSVLQKLFIWVPNALNIHATKAWHNMRQVFKPIQDLLFWGLPGGIIIRGDISWEISLVLKTTV
jgi:hypothetical protein